VSTNWPLLWVVVVLCDVLFDENVGIAPNDLLTGLATLAKDPNCHPVTRDLINR
jgi:hypothetical protein